MHPHTRARHWDGSPATTTPRRRLRVAPTSPSRLLRTGQNGHCRDCGNRIDWYPRSNHRPIALHPQEVATHAVADSCRWHLSGGIAYRHADATAWCRIPHTVLCPRHTSDRPLGPDIEALRRHLALHTRRLIDTGTFTPPTTPTCNLTPARLTRTPERPVVQILYTRYLADRPLTSIQCVAQTRQRRRCPHPILNPAAPTGTWILTPAHPIRPGQLALPDTPMALYDLSHLPYAEQLRWRAQRCPAHAATASAPDLTLPGWQRFDPLTHHPHIHACLPDTAPAAQEA
ncbi:DUF6083 domain-containing protein [Streptomyces apocyni]|uniref:DUF6083 domain-containing protein n=1 Tax=Streptomyces apocyni TaxID=2654677 RepID=UPI0012EA17DF|nr:DUF6083 domain-containing protein [Streptomyces apocyni]